ncbi:glutathione S-transferase [Klebsiella pneumoniae]|uniref:Glutathione S-transferase n=1 Tax=Klebsiella pneumoniae TaxID=573 RepID=A0A378BQD1_KLEPN|nr:glutathione S-transferase [Klebsiella pneumoniae]
MALGARAGDYYPPALREQIDELNGWIYDNVNNGVYKAGFATSQQAYDEAVDAVFTSLERLEQILGQHRYLTGNQANGSRHSPLDNAGTLRPGICDPF